MSANKTIVTNQDVTQFINQIENESQRNDSIELVKMMGHLSKQPAKMWGSSIIGFGSYHYKYQSGREGDFMRLGFSPRKQNLSLYIISGFEQYQALLAQLGKHKTGKSCLYINKLADINQAVLKKIIAQSLKYMAKKYPDHS